jgi:hypothetical protein
MRKKVTVIEKYYVEQHMDILTPEDMGKALGWQPSLVKKYIKHLKEGVSKEGTVQAEKTESVPASSVEPPSATPILSSANLIAKKKDRGFVAMTKAASEVGDEIRKEHGGPCVSEAMKKFIHRPFKE